MHKRGLTFWQVFCSLTFAVLVLPIGLRQWIELQDRLPDDELRMLRLVHRQVVEDYVENRSPSELMLDAISGMVSKLDRHSTFVPPAEVARFENEEIRGAYEGIGVLLVAEHSPPTIRWPIPGGPAEQAGLRVGDRILAVDGHDLSRVAATDVVQAASERLLGPAQTKVTLTIGRDGQEPIELSLRRGNVSRDKVKWVHLLAPKDGIGYAHLTGFQHDTVRALDDAVADLERRNGGPLRALILDLRFNAGGLLREAVLLSNRFLASGTIVTLKRRDSELVEAHESRAEQCRWPTLPLVVLINERSASASEVFTGAMQDHARARIVGARSYGKGVVQSIFQWGDYDFRLKLTTAHYYTPNGRSIERGMRRNGDGEAVGGIEPDVAEPLSPRDDERIERTLDAPESPERYREAAAALGASIGFTLALAPDPSTDAQLRTAAAEAVRLASEAPGRDAREEGR